MMATWFLALVGGAALLRRSPSSRRKEPWAGKCFDPQAALATYVEVSPLGWAAIGIVVWLGAFSPWWGGVRGGGGDPPPSNVVDAGGAGAAGG